MVRAYQETCAAPIQRYDGHIAQHLGDGLLVYFGYPRVHEDDAQRAVRAIPGILEGMDTLNARLERGKGLRSQGIPCLFLCDLHACVSSIKSRRTRLRR